MCVCLHVQSLDNNFACLWPTGPKYEATHLTANIKTCESICVIFGTLQHYLVLNTSVNSVFIKFVTQSGATYRQSQQHGFSLAKSSEATILVMFEDQGHRSKVHGHRRKNVLNYSLWMRPPLRAFHLYNVFLSGLQMWHIKYVRVFQI